MYGILWGEHYLCYPKSLKITNFAALWHTSDVPRENSSKLWQLSITSNYAILLTRWQWFCDWLSTVFASILYGAKKSDVKDKWRRNACAHFWKKPTKNLWSEWMRLMNCVECLISGVDSIYRNRITKKPSTFTAISPKRQNGAFGFHCATKEFNHICKAFLITWKC